MKALRILLCLLLLLVSLLLPPRCATSVASTARRVPECPPIFIVGDVRATSARILHDRLPEVDRVTVRVHVSSTNASFPPTVYRVLQEMVLPLTPSNRPEVLVLRDLLPHHHYIVSFLLSPSGRHEEIVRFRTPMTAFSTGDEHSSVDPQRVLVVSCDRFVDDHDDALWQRLADDLDRHRDTHVGMAHIGDQVYVDSGAVQIVSVPVELLHRPIEELRAHYDAVVVGAFRAVYRETFGRRVMQRVLRQGAHWMIPDDHEVLNNLNRASVARVFAPRGSHESDDAFAQRLGLQLHYRAGLQTIYEFQYQLRGDIPWADVDFLRDSYAAILTRYPLHFAVEMPPLQLYFLDVRFDPSVTESVDGDEKERLVSVSQLHDVRRQLEQWRERGNGGHVVVFASVPLFLHSSLTADIAFRVEKEVYPGHVATHDAQQELLDVLMSSVDSENATLRLLVGGDVHMLAHTQVCLSSSRCLDQLVTSGVTRRSTAIEDAKLLPFYLLLTRLEPLRHAALAWWRQRPWRLHTSRVFFGRNYGVLEVDPRNQFEWRHSVEYPHDAWSQRIVQSLMDAWPLLLVLLLAVVMLLLRGLIFCIRVCCSCCCSRPSASSTSSSSSSTTKHKNE